MQGFLEQGRLRESMVVFDVGFPDDCKRSVLGEVASRNSPEGFYIQRLLKFWIATKEEKLSYLWHISQLLQNYDDAVILEILEESYKDPDPVARGEIAYGVAWEYRDPFSSFIRSLRNDSDPWVREQVTCRARHILSAPLSDLIRFAENTRGHSYDEDRSYQLLARIRKVLRQQAFEFFPADSMYRNLITAIINATNRTTAKNFRVKYLSIFRDSLEALRSGAETTASLEERLLEIDDEL